MYHSQTKPFGTYGNLVEFFLVRRTNVTDVTNGYIAIGAQSQELHSCLFFLAILAGTGYDTLLSTGLYSLLSNNI